MYQHAAREGSPRSLRIAAWWPSEYGPLLAALLISALILVGTALGSGALAGAGVVLALGAAVVAPSVGLAVLAILAPLRSPAVVPAPGFNTMLVAALLLGCIYRLPIDRPRLRMSLPLMLLLAFIAFVSIQQVPDLLTGYAGLERRRIGYLYIQLATLAGMAVATAYVLRGRRPEPFLAAGITGATFASLLGIATFVLPPGSVANLVDLSDPLARVVGPFGDPNYFALFNATAIAACVALMIVLPSGRLRVLLAGAAVLIGFSLAAALSRAALAALGAGIVLLAFTRSRRAGILTVATFGVLALVAYPLFVEWRLGADAGGVTAQAVAALEGSDRSRFGAALAGLDMFASSPVLGIGFGAYAETSARYVGYSIESHNWYVNVLAEQGLVGFALWMALLAATAFRLQHSERSARTVGLAVLTTYAVGSFFLQPPLSVQTSAFTVIVVTAALVADWSGLRPDPSLPPAAIT